MEYSTYSRRFVLRLAGGATGTPLALRLAGLQVVDVDAEMSRGAAIESSAATG